MQSLWMIAAALFYAAYAMFVKFAGEASINSWQILFYRSIFGVVIFYVLMRYRGIQINTSHPIEHIVRSLAGTMAILAGIFSMMHLNLGLAMTLNYTAPLFMGIGVVAYSLKRHAHINWGLISTLLAGFCGVVLLLGPTLSPHEYGAAVIGLMAGLCTAIATGFVKRLGLLKEPDPRIIFYLVLVGSFCGLAGVLITGGFTPWTMAGALYIAAFCICSTLGQFFLTKAFSRGNLVLSSSLQYSVILFSTILGELVFNEPLTFFTAVGMVIIIVSGILASYLVKKNNEKLKAAVRKDAVSDI